MNALNLNLIENHEISGDEKLRRVTQLVRELRADLKEFNFLPQERNAAMEQLKIFVRDPKNAEPIYTPEGMEILIHHGFHSTSATTSRAALQALANALLSEPRTRQIFVDSGYSLKAVARLKNPKRDDEFLLSRVLFLTSYGTTQSFPTLIDKHHLADHLNDNIARHAKNHIKLGHKSPSSQEDNALSETLKLLFNITHFNPSCANKFHKSIGPIIKIISLRSINLTSPTHHLVGNLVNSLLNLSLREKKAFPSKSDLKIAVEKLTAILDYGLSLYNVKEELESSLMPLLALLKSLARAAPHETRLHLEKLLLPLVSAAGEQFVSFSTLGHKLLEHMHSPISTQLHKAIKSLFLELLDQDADKLEALFSVSPNSSFTLSQTSQTRSNPSFEHSVRSNSVSTLCSSIETSSCSSITSQTFSPHGKMVSPITSPIEEVFPRPLHSDDWKPPPIHRAFTNPFERPLDLSKNRTISAPTVVTTVPTITHTRRPSTPRSQSHPGSQLAVEQATANLEAILASKPSRPAKPIPAPLKIPAVSTSTSASTSLSLSKPTTVRPQPPPPPPIQAPPALPQLPLPPKPTPPQKPVNGVKSVATDRISSITPHHHLHHHNPYPRPHPQALMQRSITAPVGTFRTKGMLLAQMEAEADADIQAQAQAQAGLGPVAGMKTRNGPGVGPECVSSDGAAAGASVVHQKNGGILYGAVDIDFAIARKLDLRMRAVGDGDGELDGFEGWEF